MLLCVDCGNTNTVFAVWNGAEIVATFRTSTEHQRTADQYYVWFSTLMEHRGLPIDIDAVIVSSTVPRVVFNLRVFSDRYFSCRPRVVGKPDCALPIEPRVDAGTRVGPDRLANAAGAWDRHGGDLIVVDFGTATNFDVVAEDGAYVGGVIAPGVNLSLEALHVAAAALPHVDVTMPPQVIGRNTVDCMQSGVFWGYVGLISGICARIKAEYGRPMKVISTGGLAPLFQQGDTLFDMFEDDLTIHGLTVIHSYNHKNGVHPAP
ncbi:type III pantothenate kinase [Roseicyclus sp. F158]|uniref:Type III pantothenate kinase n=1 Tax=Tropicimonas omnivorans TaxID=3075590 RepID=A0ABU3DIY9_9RHOB|nr:type III pantothenate kinase [Roseicyclus sp. F158]MDT0683694.1 type III pantothenate kinase [Roseicyclus sp. F158]